MHGVQIWILVFSMSLFTTTGPMPLLTEFTSSWVLYHPTSLHFFVDMNSHLHGHNYKIAIYKTFFFKILPRNILPYLYLAEPNALRLLVFCHLNFFYSSVVHESGKHTFNRGILMSLWNLKIGHPTFFSC